MNEKYDWLECFGKVYANGVRKQQLQKGYTHEFDERWENGELAKAAVAYILNDSSYWPWDESLFKPSDQKAENYGKASALLMAEIDRLIRIGEIDPITKAIAAGIQHRKEHTEKYISLSNLESALSAMHFRVGEKGYVSVSNLQRMFKALFRILPEAPDDIAGSADQPKGD